MNSSPQKAIGKLGVAPGLWALGLILAAWASGPTAARADNIDLALLDEAPKIMAYLHKQGYKNVGVLEFRVQKGKEHADFGTGTLNSNMATRLENALILLDDPADPIGVVRDASQHALSRDKKATYLTADGRKALMAASYPLAWGKEVVKPDDPDTIRGGPRIRYPRTDAFHRLFGYYPRISVPK